MKTCTTPLYLRAACALLLAAGAARPAAAASISEGEAVAIAEWWYANEISSPHTTLTSAERSTRLANRSQHQVHSILGRDRLQAKRQPNESVMAYVVAFQPSG